MSRNNSHQAETASPGIQAESPAPRKATTPEQPGHMRSNAHQEQVLNLSVQDERKLFSGFYRTKHAQYVSPGSDSELAQIAGSYLNQWRAERGLSPVALNDARAMREATRMFQRSVAIGSDGSIAAPKLDQHGQRVTGLEDDGIIGSRTLYALRKSLGREDLVSFHDFVRYTGGVYDISHVRQKWLASDLDIPNEVRTRLYDHVRKSGLSPEFLELNDRIARKHGATGDQLLVMYWAENHFKTGRHHPHSTTRLDTGLIGFTPVVAGRLGTSVDALAQMNGVQQLHYVDRYLTMVERDRKVRLDSFADVYMAIYRPTKADDSDNVAVRIGKKVVRKGDVPELLYKRV